jgi:hypothetical protein
MLKLISYLNMLYFSMSNFGGADISQSRALSKQTFVYYLLGEDITIQKTNSFAIRPNFI